MSYDPYARYGSRKKFGVAALVVAVVVCGGLLFLVSTFLGPGDREAVANGGEEPKEAVKALHPLAQPPGAQP